MHASILLVFTALLSGAVPSPLQKAPGIKGSGTKSVGSVGSFMVYNTCGSEISVQRATGQETPLVSKLPISKTYTSPYIPYPNPEQKAVYQISTEIQGPSDSPNSVYPTVQINIAANYASEGEGVFYSIELLDAAHEYAGPTNWTVVPSKAGGACQAVSVAVYPPGPAVGTDCDGGNGCLDDLPPKQKRALSGARCPANTNLSIWPCAYLP